MFVFINRIRSFIINLPKRIKFVAAKYLGLGNGVQAWGVYSLFVNGKFVEECWNLLPTEGLNHLLDVGLSGGAQDTSWHLTLYKTNIAPAAGWTAANFHATAAEINTTTEVDEANRPAWSDGGVASGQVDNYASKADFTVAVASISVWGAALLSTNTFQGTSGVLMSATKFSAVQTLAEDSVLSVGYRVALTSS